MATTKPSGSSAGRPRKPVGKNIHVTKSGKTIKLHQSLAERIKSHKEEAALRRAERLRDMPKSRIKRFFYRMNPKRMYKYWFSREGGIMALKIVGISFVVIFVTMIGVFAYFRKDLPNLHDISGNNIGGSVQYYDKTGQTLLWEDYDQVKRIPIKTDQINQYVKDATVAIEDRDFYKHGGFDLKGITRAAVANVSGGGTSQGGSTITQQLVKLSQDWTKDRSYTRKIKELILSVEVERSYSKDEILTGYLNAAPYGNIEYGVEAGARDYFQKSAKDLTLAESVFLAAIPRSPSYYSPYGPYFDKSLLKGRTEYILNVMAETGKITTKQRDDAKKIDVVATVKKQPPKYGAIKAPYFVLSAKQEVEKLLSSQQSYNLGGWKVITTLDLNLQTLAEKSVADGKAQMTKQGADTAAFVAEDNETGQVVALVGGSGLDAPGGQLNFASDVNISPGSTIKPYDYVTFIENNNNVGAGSVLYDQVGPLPGYACSGGAPCLNDYDKQSPGPVTLRYALGGSRNIPAAKAMLSAVPGDTSVGKTTSINKVLSTASGLMGTSDGYHCYVSGTDITKASKTDETQCYTSAAIGDGAYLNLDNHVNGIASIARLGKSIPQTYILKITNGSNKTIDEFKQPKGTQAVRADSAYIVSDMASDPKASYLGGSCTDTNCTSYKFHRYKGWHNAIKTGTTNDLLDGLMMSWNTKYTAGIWVGDHTRTIPYTGQPEYMTDPIMKQFMQGAIDQLGNVPPVNWTKPAGIKTAAAFVMTKSVGFGQSIPSSSTDIFPAWYQTKNTNNTKASIDIISNKLATECTPELAKKDLDGANSNSFSGDIFVGSNAANLNEKDDVHQCADERPTISMTPSATGNQITLTATIAPGSKPLPGNTDKGAGRVNFIVGGQNAQSQNITDGVFSYTYTFTPTSPGTTVAAQVIDSVMYDATSTSATVAPISLSSPSASKFSWSGNNGAVTVYRTNGTAVPGCLNVGTTSCTGIGIPGGTQVYAKDNANYISPTIASS